MVTKKDTLQILVTNLDKIRKLPVCNFNRILYGLKHCSGNCLLNLKALPIISTSKVSSRQMVFFNRNETL